MSDLLNQARAARARAYAPYSKFQVGAAVLGASGKVYTGSNIENASYGLTVCAERVAIFKAISEGETSLKRIAISCPTSADGPVESLMPCGACRQVMSEFFPQDTPVEIDNVGKISLQELLPMGFKL